jgi:uncharacterized membrane protein HdeD (DUF308 family)
MVDGYALGARRIAKESVGWSIAFAILLIVIGLLCLAAPVWAGVAVTAVVGWLLIFGGIAHLILAWHVRGIGSHIWEALVGLAYIFAGVYVLVHPLAGLVGLTLFLGFYLLFKGIFELFMGLRLRPLPGSGWLLVDAAITILLAILIWMHLPSSAGWAIGTLLGVAILFSGISRLALSMSARRALA